MAKHSAADKYDALMQYGSPEQIALFERLEAQAQQTVGAVRNMGETGCREIIFAIGDFLDGTTEGQREDLQYDLRHKRLYGYKLNGKG